MKYLSHIKGYKRFAVFPIFFLVRLLDLFFTSLSLKKSKVLAIYCGGNRGNIIDLLLRDLIRSGDSNTRLKVVFYYDLPKLLFAYIFYEVNIFCCHYALIRDLSFYGIPLSRISSFYTHSYLDRLHASSLLHCSKLFVINKSELSFLQASRIPKEKLVYFPLGIDLQLLKNKLHSPSSSLYDVVFSLSYTNQSIHSHYYQRKRYPFFIKLVNFLVSLDFRVAIIGSNWSLCKSLDMDNHLLSIHDVAYPDYMSIYANSKVYCMPSLIEGSPTGFAEAMLADCQILSCPTGWALDLMPMTNYGISLIGFDADPKDWASSIQDLKSTPITSDQRSCRSYFLDTCNFASLHSLLLSHF